MLAVYDFIPKFCPNCGQETRLDGYGPNTYLVDPQHRYRRDADFNAHASHTCDCGMSYQRAGTNAILKAAEISGGDMKQYHNA